MFLIRLLLFVAFVYICDDFFCCHFFSRGKEGILLLLMFEVVLFSVYIFVDLLCCFCQYLSGSNLCLFMLAFVFYFCLYFVDFLLYLCLYFC